MNIKEMSIEQLLDELLDKQSDIMVTAIANNDVTGMGKPITDAKQELLTRFATLKAENKKLTDALFETQKHYDWDKPFFEHKIAELEAEKEEWLQQYNKITLVCANQDEKIGLLEKALALACEDVNCAWCPIMETCLEFQKDSYHESSVCIELLTTHFKERASDETDKDTV